MIGIINGSPKAQGGASEKIVGRLREKLGGDAVVLSSRSDGEEGYERLAACETVIAVFPIYVDALPSHLLRFLMGWEEHRKERGGGARKLYAISHAGFYEGKQCRWSLEVLRNFCVRADIRWSGGVGLGAAPILVGQLPEKMFKALFAEIDALGDAAAHGAPVPENRYASAGMPRWMYKAAGNMGWKSGAKQNSLKPKDLYRTE